MSDIDKQARQVSRYDLVSGYMQKWPDGESFITPTIRRCWMSWKPQGSRLLSYHTIFIARTPLSKIQRRLDTQPQTGFCAVVMRSGTLMRLNWHWPQPVKERHHEHR